MKRLRLRYLCGLLVTVLVLGISGILVLHAERQQNVNALLVQSIRKNDRFSILRLLEQGANPQTSIEARSSSLWAFVRQLLSPRHARPPSRTAFQLYTDRISDNEPGKEGKEDAEVVHAFLKQRADPNATDANECPFLVLACQDGMVATVQFLLEYGAQVDQRASDRHRTALMETGNPALIRLLLAHGADINAGDENGYTALTEACKEGEDNSRVALLLARGADANGAKGSDWSPLMNATSFSISSGGNEAKSICRCAAMLLAHGANINAKMKRGNRFLCWRTSQYIRDLIPVLFPILQYRDTFWLTAQT